MRYKIDIQIAVKNVNKRYASEFSLCIRNIYITELHEVMYIKHSHINNYIKIIFTQPDGSNWQRIWALGGTTIGGRCKYA